MNAPITAAGTVADRIAVATLSCPAVARLHGGRFGEVATYLPGRRISGVRLRSAPDDDPAGTGPAGISTTGISTAGISTAGISTVEIHVVGRYPATVDEIATQVRTALRPLVGAARVDVVVGDYTGPADPTGTAGPAPARTSGAVPATGQIEHPPADRG